MLALPTLWRGRPPSEVAAGLLDVLMALLRTESAYVEIHAAIGTDELTDWRPRNQPITDDLRQAITHRLDEGSGIVAWTLSGDLGKVNARAAGAALARFGRVFLCSTRDDFPNQRERFLISVAAEQAVLSMDIATSVARERAARADAEALAARNAELLAQAEEQAALQVELNEALRESASLEHESRAEAETLLAVAQLLAADLDIDRLVQAVTDAATGVSGAEFGAFFHNLVSADGESYTRYSLSGVSPEAFANFPLPRNTPLFEPTFRGTGVVRVDDVLCDPRYGRMPPHHGMPPGHLPVRSYLAVPVVSRSGEVLGGLFFGHSEPGRFTQRAERLVSGIAAQAAAVIDNARLYQQLQMAIRTRDEFLSSAAHDLKTPVTTIKGLAQFLARQSQRGSLVSEQLDGALSSIDDAANSIARQVDEVTDLTRLDLGQSLQLNRRTVGLSQVVNRVAAARTQTSSRHRIEIDARVQPIGKWDEARIERVVDNLVANAIRYTPNGGDVRITVGVDGDSTGQWALLTVSDTGLGIPEADLPRVFDRFYRGSNVVGRIPGSGIGLAGVRQIVEQHGGTIQVSSREGEGSTFTVRLPLDADDQ